MEQSCCNVGAQTVFYVCMSLGAAGAHPSSRTLRAALMRAFRIPSGRVVFFTFAPFIREGWQFPMSVNIFLNSYPSFFFFTGFSILLTLWAEVRFPPAVSCGPVCAWSALFTPLWK